MSTTKTIKEEKTIKYKDGSFMGKFGTLTLTEDDVKFNKEDGLFSGGFAISIPLESISSVHAEKALFLDNCEYLIIKTNKGIEHKFEYISVGNNIKGFMYFKGWEDAIQKQRNFEVESVIGADELGKYAELRDKGVITQEEFDAKKKKILGL